MLVACVLQLGSLLFQAVFSIDYTKELDFEPSVVGLSYSQKLIHIPAPKDGPVVVMFEFEVDSRYGRQMFHAVRELRLIYLRNGAVNWRLHEDLGRPNTYCVEMMYPSWTQYLLMQERMTNRERAIVEKVLAFHVGERRPDFRHFLCVDRELADFVLRSDEVFPEGDHYL